MTLKEPVLLKAMDRSIKELHRAIDSHRYDEEEGPMTLDQLQPGNKCRIIKLMIHDQLGQRLLDMGVYPGLTLKVIRNAPLKDPMEISLGGFFVSLRHDEARYVEVSLL